MRLVTTLKVDGIKVVVESKTKAPETTADEAKKYHNRLVDRIFKSVSEDYYSQHIKVSR